MVTNATKVSGKIAKGGMGCFLNPPKHPEYYCHVKNIAGDKRAGRFNMSLEAAADSTSLDDHIRGVARKILRQWKPLPLDSEPVQNWIHHVLGYYKNCYSKDGVGHDVNKDMVVDKSGERNLDTHLGVMHIRRYYPEYVPSDADFENAYWGKESVS